MNKAYILLLLLLLVTRSAAETNSVLVQRDVPYKYEFELKGISLVDLSIQSNDGKYFDVTLYNCWELRNSSIYCSDFSSYSSINTTLNQKFILESGMWHFLVTTPDDLVEITLDIDIKTTLSIPQFIFLFLLLIGSLIVYVEIGARRSQRDKEFEAWKGENLDER